jgi:signal transduction histidine kinase/CheY-like chemotaxis protein
MSADAEWPAGLHKDLVPWFALSCAGTGLLLAISDPDRIGMPAVSSLGMLLLGLAVFVALLQGRWPVTASWLLVLGSLALSVLTCAWFPEVGARHTVLLVVVEAVVLLGVGPGCAVALAAGLLLHFGAAEPVRAGLAPGAAVTDSVLLANTVIVVAATRRVYGKTILALAQASAHARQALDGARNRQLELKQTLLDLDLANREVIRLNDLLRAARESIEEARRAKEEFVANVSHELRTPLNMIIGFSDEILGRPRLYSRRLPQQLLEDVGAIKRNSEHLARLVDDVLDLSQVDAGFMRLTREWTSLGEVIAEARQAVSVFFERKGLLLDATVAAGVPRVYCDRVRIRQVILNLLSNAARFTDRGGATIEATSSGNSVTVRVTDTGPGIGVETLPHLFEPFQQADPSIRRRYGGTGLGLAISKRFVEMHGGRIWVESGEASGTTVSFSLPIEGYTPPLPVKRWFSPYHDYAPRTRTALLPGANPQPRIVVVESGHILSALVEHHLVGLEVTTVSSIEEAICLARTVAVTAFIINQMQPVSRASPLPGAPPLLLDVPVLTCWVPEQQPEVQQMGVQAYLVKPVRRDDLLASIRLARPEARHILLVDDDEEARQLFVRMLSDGPGFVITEASDGTGALDALRNARPDVMLLDLVMPGVDGFAVLAAKASDESIRGIAVVAISARDPHREPIVSSMLSLARQRGLSARDLVGAIEAIVGALPPAFGAPGQRGTAPQSPASA